MTYYICTQHGQWALSPKNYNCIYKTVHGVFLQQSSVPFFFPTTLLPKDKSSGSLEKTLALQISTLIHGYSLYKWYKSKLPHITDSKNAKLEHKCDLPLEDDPLL